MKSESEIISLLDSLGNNTDPIADLATKTLIEENELPEVQLLFPGLKNNANLLPPNSPPVALKFFEDTGELPHWIDGDLIKYGERAYTYFGPECLILLLFKSLPVGYSMWHVAKTLHITGKLSEHRGNLDKLTRRILETLQFVVNVMEPGGFHQNGKTVITTQKIKFIHGTIRNKIVDTDQWNSSWNNPINQEEILMTFLSFSLIVIKGLNQLGINLNKEDQEGILHLWKIVGYTLGLKDELQPKNIQEAELYWKVIVGRNRTKYTTEGQELTDSLIAYGKSLLPNLLQFFPGLLVYYLNSKKINKLLKVPRPNPFLLLMFIPIRFLMFLFQLLRQFSPVTRFIFRRFHLILVKGLILHWNKNQPITFTIPTNLQGSWSLKKFWNKQGFELQE